MSLGEGRFNWQLSLGIVLLDLVCKMLIAPALIYALTSVLKTGEEPGVSEAYRNGSTSLGKLALCAIASWTLQGIGFLLLIIPGIIIWLALTLVYPVAVLEKRSVIDTLSRSWNLTKGASRADFSGLDRGRDFYMDYRNTGFMDFDAGQPGVALQRSRARRWADGRKPVYLPLEVPGAANAAAFAARAGVGSRVIVRGTLEQRPTPPHTYVIVVERLLYVAPPAG